MSSDNYDNPTLGEMLECAVEMQRELGVPIGLSLDALRDTWDLRQMMKTKTTRDLYEEQAKALDRIYGDE